MNELSQFLVESILGEADSVSNKVVVYAGRFQPFHKGHYATYSHLVKKFGKDNVYIGTSNKTDNVKSPFNFKEKVMVMTTMFGIPKNRIVEVKNPYVPTEVLKKFDKDTTAFITVVGKKDASRLGGKFFTPYKDNLDFEGYEDRGYVYIAPQQPNPISGTDVRKELGSGSDEDKKTFFIKRAYPKFNDKIFKLITNKLSKINEERIFISKEQIEEWLVQNVDLIKEASKILGASEVDDGPNYIYPNFATFDRVSQKRAEQIGYTVLSQIMSDELTDIDDHPQYPNGPVKAVTPFPAGVAGKTTATNQKDFYGSQAYDKWWKHVTRVAGLVGYSLVDFIDLNVDKDQSLRDLGAERNEVGNVLKLEEDIKLPVNVGDTILTGRFKNKKTVVKTIGKDEHGMPTINGRKVVNFRILKEGVQVQLDEIPMADLVKIDTYADKQLNPIDVVLTDKHFFDRLNDPRNDKEISQAELIGFFKRLGKKRKDFINFLNLYGQIVAKDNRSKINIPFMKQANKVIAKTIMRKDDFKTSSPEYKFEVTPHGYPDQKWIDNHNKELKRLRNKFDKEPKEKYYEPALGGGITERIIGDSVVCDKCNWTWKLVDGGLDVFICHKCGHNNQPKLSEGLLTEGGAYGHMNHPFDTEINLTFGQLKDIVNKALEGNLELAREKTDGQALAVSWRDGRLVAARNKGHLKNKGENALDINGVATKFAGRGELEKAYNFAMKDLSNAISKLSDKQKEKVFKGGACFMNLEVIYPTSVNVIPYGQALLVFHGTMEYNDDGIAIGENQEAARILAGMIKQVNAEVQSAYTIQGPPINELPKSKDLTKLKGKYNSQISKLQSKFKLKDNDGIADYHQAFWMDFVTKKSPSTLDNKTLMGLVKRWAFYDKSFRLDTKNITDEKTLEWTKGIDKNDHAKIAKDNIRPFEDIFLGIGADILSFMSSVLAANPDKAVRDMKKRLDQTIKDVKKSGDVKKIEKLKLELQRLNAIGGKDKIVPNEGIVFVYGGKTFKLTGTFAPLNQILGLFYE